MTNIAKILRDLEAGQSTADSIAGRLNIHKDAVELICRQLVAERKIITVTLGATNLLVYRLNNTIPVQYPKP